MIGFDSPNWGKSPYNEKQELSDMEYDAEIERLTELGIAELQQGGFCAKLKIDFRDVFDDIVFTSLEYLDLGVALHDIYHDYPSLRPLLDKHIEYVARIAAEHKLNG